MYSLAMCDLGPRSAWGTCISMYMLESSPYVRLPAISEITSCDATTEDCQFGQSATGDSNNEITPYSSTTKAEIHPQAPPTSEDPPNSSLPRLAPPNLVVAMPTECPQKTLTLPPPRGRGLRRWEMSYANLWLRQGLGWGNTGVVVKATLIKDDYNQRVVNRLARLEKSQGGGEHQWMVAVKRTKGGCICWREAYMGMLCGTHCWTGHLIVCGW